MFSGRKTSHWAWWVFPTERQGGSEPRPATSVTPSTASHLLQRAPESWRQCLEEIVSIVSLAAPNPQPHTHTQPATEPLGKVVLEGDSEEGNREEGKGETLAKEAVGKVVLEAPRNLVELTENAIRMIWASEDVRAYTVQMLEFSDMGEGKGYKISVSDGNSFTIILINNKPDIDALLEEKGEGLVNSICSIQVSALSLLVFQQPSPFSSIQVSALFLLFNHSIHILVNSIHWMQVKSSWHPKNPGQKLLFLETLKVLASGSAVNKIGQPVKFQSENQAKKDSTKLKQVCSC